MTLGTQYKKELKNRSCIKHWGYPKVGNDLKVTGDEYLYSLTFTNVGNEFGRDTISQSSISGNYKLPLKAL